MTNPRRITDARMVRARVRNQREKTRMLVDLANRTRDRLLWAEATLEAVAGIAAARLGEDTTARQEIEDAIAHYHRTAKP